MTTTTLPTWNPDMLARALREQNLPGQRSKTAITKLRRQRAKQKQWRDMLASQLQADNFGRMDRMSVRPSLMRRANARIAARYTAEITRRGGETSIDSKDRSVPLAITDRPTGRWLGEGKGLVLLHAEGWRYYSSRFGHRIASLSYLCGTEDGHPWAVRVPGTITTVAEALTWITPAEVVRARHAGKRVERQGDVYAVETTKAHDGKGDLPDRHIWDATARVLAHPEHGTLHLPYPVRFIGQRSYGMGRGAGRGCGD